MGAKRTGIAADRSGCMILRIVALKVCGAHQLDVAFNNGVRKRIDIGPLLDGPVFKRLRSSKYFAQAILDDECGTVVWPNGADLAPEALLELPEWNGKLTRRKKAMMKAGK